MTVRTIWPTGSLSPSPGLWLGLGLPLAWIGARLLVDGLLMPLLFSSGMMQSTDFPSMAGIFFASLDRLELMAAATLLTVTLLGSRPGINKRFLLAANLLLAIALLQTYWLTPSLTGLGFAALQSGEMPSAMPLQQGLLWSLEAVKLIILAALAFQTSLRLHWD